MRLQSYKINYVFYGFWATFAKDTISVWQIFKIHLIILVPKLAFFWKLELSWAPKHWYVTTNKTCDPHVKLVYGHNFPKIWH